MEDLKLSINSGIVAFNLLVIFVFTMPYYFLKASLEMGIASVVVTSILITMALGFSGRLLKVMRNSFLPVLELFENPLRISSDRKYLCGEVTLSFLQCGLVISLILIMLSNFL